MAGFQLCTIMSALLPYKPRNYANFTQVENHTWQYWAPRVFSEVCQVIWLILIALTSTGRNSVSGKSNGDVSGWQDIGVYAIQDRVRRKSLRGNAMRRYRDGIYISMTNARSFLSDHMPWYVRLASRSRTSECSKCSPNTHFSSLVNRILRNVFLTRKSELPTRSPSDMRRSHH